MTGKSALDPRPAELADVPGFRTGAASCGLKTKGLDVGVIAGGVAGTAVFTRNAVTAAPVKVSRPRAREGRLCAVVVNSGGANCCTGPDGLRDAEEMTRLAAGEFGVGEDRVLVASTGVIGRALPMDRVRRGVGEACRDATADGHGDLASAILTTDTVRKIASASGTINGKPFCVAGAAKGAGMIAPNMATCLAFLVTDAAATPEYLQELLPAVAERTFNRVTVDGDTSTNDTLCLLSSGATGNSARAEGGEALSRAVEAVARELAIMVAADGEGATKLIEVRVTGAADDREAELAARAVAESPLVKTAAHGADPNWGRILAAAGRSGARAEEARTTVRLAGTSVFERGSAVPLGPGALDKLRDELRGEKVLVELDLGAGAGSAVIWTCDLTKEYVEINAHYHT